MSVVYYCKQCGIKVLANDKGKVPNDDLCSLCAGRSCPAQHRQHDGTYHTCGLPKSPGDTTCGKHQCETWHRSVSKPPSYESVVTNINQRRAK